jgi:hypothetical protein
MLERFKETTAYLAEQARKDVDENVSYAAFFWKRFEDRYGEQIADLLIDFYLAEQKQYVAELNNEADAVVYQRSVEG